MNEWSSLCGLLYVRLRPLEFYLLWTTCLERRPYYCPAISSCSENETRVWNWQVALAHMNLGAMLHYNGKLRQAEQSYTSALRLQPNDDVTRANLEKLRSRLRRQWHRYRHSAAETGWMSTQCTIVGVPNATTRPARPSITIITLPLRLAWVCFCGREYFS